MILVIGLYSEPVRARAEEIAHCFVENRALAAISRVHVILEDPYVNQELLSHPKVTTTPLHRRMTFDDAFRIINAWPSAGSVTIANNDICFDETIGILENIHEKAFSCLTRWEGKELYPTPSLCQDAWTFRAPMKATPSAPFHLGELGSDQRIAYQAQAAGYFTINPCGQVRAQHHHASNVRRRSDRLTGPYAYIARTDMIRDIIDAERGPHHHDSST